MASQLWCSNRHPGFEVMGLKVYAYGPPCALCGKSFCRNCGAVHTCGEPTKECSYSLLNQDGDVHSMPGGGSELVSCRPGSLGNLGRNIGQRPPQGDCGPATTLNVPGRGHGAPRQILGPKAGFRPPVAVAFDVGGLPPDGSRWVRPELCVVSRQELHRRRWAAEAAHRRLPADPSHPKIPEPECDSHASLVPCAPQATAAPCDAESVSASSSGDAPRERSRSPSSAALISRLDLERELRKLEDALSRRQDRLDFDSDNLASAKKAVRRLEDRLRKSKEDVASTKEHIANTKARFPYFE